jgi:hypothetical protein
LPRKVTPVSRSSPDDHEKVRVTIPHGLTPEEPPPPDEGELPLPDEEELSTT